MIATCAYPIHRNLFEVTGKIDKDEKIPDRHLPPQGGRQWPKANGRLCPDPEVEHLNDRGQNTEHSGDCCRLGVAAQGRCRALPKLAKQRPGCAQREVVAGMAPFPTLKIPTPVGRKWQRSPW